MENGNPGTRNSMCLIKSGYSRKSLTLSRKYRGDVGHSKADILELGRGQIKKVYKPNPVGSRSNGKI